MNIDIKLDTDVMLAAIREGFAAVIESDGKRPALVLIGQVGTVSFELGVYDMEKMEADAEEHGIYMEMSDPAIYEQLKFKFH